jgi:ATP-dependent Lon protease
MHSEVEALRRAVMQQFDQYVKLNKKIPPEILTSISSIDDPGRLADTIARTCRSSSTTSRWCWICSTSRRAWKTCSSSLSAKSTSSMSTRRSAAA